MSLASTAVTKTMRGGKLARSQEKVQSPGGTCSGHIGTGSSIEAEKPVLPHDGSGSVHKATVPWTMQRVLSIVHCTETQTHAHKAA